MSRKPQPPVGIDASGPPVPLAKRDANAPRRRRDVTVATPDLSRWGTATTAEMRQAADLLDDLTDALKGGPDTDDAERLAGLYFERGEAAGVSVAALVRHAVEAIGRGLRTDPTDVQSDMADVLEAAVERFGEPPEPDTYANYTHATPIPSWVYDDLPGPLADLANRYAPGSQRDTFLTSALGCINAALPGVAFRYARKWSRVNLFLAVIAESGAGKAPLIAAARLLRPINKHLLEVSDQEIDRWERAQKAKEQGALFETVDVPVERPPSRYVSFGGDIADAEFFLATHANGGHGAIIESEIATLLATMGKEWGNFRPKLLKGFENEEMTHARTRRRPLMIWHPEITLVTSGTPDAFAEWIKDNEDGLFNRTGFYTFPGTDQWRSGWDEDDRDADRMQAAEDRVASILKGAYVQLTTRRTDPTDERGKDQTPLYAVFTADQKRRLDEAFSQQKGSLVGLGFKPLANYTHRTALIALRIAAGLSAFRLACEGRPLGWPTKTFEVTEADFRVGIRLGVLYMAHGVELARRHFRGVERKTTQKAAPVTSGPPVFLDHLSRAFGSATFTRAEAVALAEREMGVKSTKADGMLKTLKGQGLLTWEYGLYARADLAPVLAAVAEASVVAPLPIGYVSNDLLWPPGSPGTDGAAGALPVLTTDEPTTGEPTTGEPTTDNPMPEAPTGDGADPF